MSVLQFYSVYAPAATGFQRDLLIVNVFLFVKVPIVYGCPADIWESNVVVLCFFCYIYLFAWLTIIIFFIFIFFRCIWNLISFKTEFSKTVPVIDTLPASSSHTTCSSYETMCVNILRPRRLKRPTVVFVLLRF